MNKNIFKKFGFYRVYPKHNSTFIWPIYAQCQQLYGTVDLRDLLHLHRATRFLTSSWNNSPSAGHIRVNWSGSIDQSADSETLFNLDNGSTSLAIGDPLSVQPTTRSMIECDLL